MVRWNGESAGGGGGFWWKLEVRVKDLAGEETRLGVWWAWMSKQTFDSGYLPCNAGVNDTPDTIRRQLLCSTQYDL